MEMHNKNAAKNENATQKNATKKMKIQYKLNDYDDSLDLLGAYIFRGNYLFKVFASDFLFIAHCLAE